MHNNVLNKGFIFLKGKVVIVGETASGKTCVVTGNSVEELQKDWEGERKFFPEDMKTAQFVSVGGNVVKKGRPVLSGRERIEDVIPNMEINTKIRYLYRDADNYKRENQVVVKGAITQAQISEIISSLHDGECFIPEQVGLPAQRMQGYAYDPQSDTPYFELGRCSFSLTGVSATVDISVDELVREFRKAEGRWDESIDIAW